MYLSSSSMDPETAHYIVNYFPRLLTSAEAALRRARLFLAQAEVSSTESMKQRLTALAEGTLTPFNEEIALLKPLNDHELTLAIAERIMQESPGRVFLNNCPRCGRLARTVQAKQCKHCFYSWHHTVVATFQKTAALTITGRLETIYLMGHLKSGKVAPGMKADLIPLGLGYKPVITAIEFADNMGAKLYYEVLGVAIKDEGDRAFLLEQRDKTALLNIEAE